MPETTTPEPCATCRGGCACDPEAGESCPHYGCHGRQAGELPSCPGAILEIAAYNAERAHRSALDRVRHSARAATYARSIAEATDAASRDVLRQIAEQHQHRQP